MMSTEVHTECSSAPTDARNGRYLSTLYSTPQDDGFKFIVWRDTGEWCESFKGEVWHVAHSQEGPFPDNEPEILCETI